MSWRTPPSTKGLIPWRLYHHLPPSLPHLTTLSPPPSLPASPDDSITTSLPPSRHWRLYHHLPPSLSPASDDSNYHPSLPPSLPHLTTLSPPPSLPPCLTWQLYHHLPPSLLPLTTLSPPPSLPASPKTHHLPPSFPASHTWRHNHLPPPSILPRHPPAELAALPRADGDVAAAVVRAAEVVACLALHAAPEEGLARVTRHAAEVVALGALAAHTAHLQRLPAGGGRRRRLVWRAERGRGQSGAGVRAGQMVSDGVRSGQAGVRSGQIGSDGGQIGSDRVRWGSDGVRLGQMVSDRVRWWSDGSDGGQLVSERVRWGQIGPDGIKWVQVGSSKEFRRVKCGNSGVSGSKLCQCGHIGDKSENGARWGQGRIVQNGGWSQCSMRTNEVRWGSAWIRPGLKLSDMSDGVWQGRGGRIRHKSRQSGER